MNRLVSLLPLLVTPLIAQTPTRFDVSTVKRDTSGQEGSRIGVRPGGSFTAERMTLKRLIRTAYNINDGQILGGPAWAERERWNIAAKAEGLPESPRPQDIIPLVQELLADRFRLRVHHEMREMPILALRVAKDGATLRTSTANLPVSSMNNRNGRLEATMATMEALAGAITRQLGRVVVDQTGLKGNYDFTLEWSPDIPVGAEESGPSGPTMFTAIQEQLGLRLEASRGQVEVIVIDGAELPEEN